MALSTTSQPMANTTDNKYGTPTAFGNYVIASYFILATIAGIVFNLFTVFVVGYGNSLYKGMKIQLINLAITDLMLATIYPALNLLLFVEISFPGNLASCGVFRFFSIMTLHATILCNSTITMEMFVIILFPGRASRYTKAQKFAVVVAIWVCSIVPEIVNSIGMEIVYFDNVQFCEGTLFNNHGSAYGWLQQGRNIISALIIVVAYTAVLIQMCRKKTNGSKFMSDEDTSIRKLLPMLVVDAFLTMITVNANSAHWFLESGDEPKRELFDLDLVFAVIVTSNAFTTPQVYLGCSKDFRIDAKQMFYKITCRGNRLLQKTDDDSDQPFLELSSKFNADAEADMHET